MALKYKVKHTSIMHNKTVYKEGSTIELDDTQAKRLEDFVELLPNQSAPAKSKAQIQTSKTASTGNKKSENKTSAKNQTKAEAETKTETESQTVTAEEESKADEKGGSDDNK